MRMRAFLASFVCLGLTAAAVEAGPALFFLYEDTSLQPDECVTRAERVMRNAALSVPSNTVRVDTTSFVIGESSSATVIVDCSTVAAAGRITVMSAARDLGTARQVTERVLRGMTGLPDNER